METRSCRIVLRSDLKVLYDSAFNAQVDDHQITGQFFSTTENLSHGQNKHNGLMQHKTGEEIRLKFIIIMLCYRQEGESSWPSTD